MVVVCYIETIVLGVNKDNVAFHKKGKKRLFFWQIRRTVSSDVNEEERTTTLHTW